MPEETKQKSLFNKEISRKDFFRNASIVGGGIAVSIATVLKSSEVKAATVPVDALNDTIKMLEELKIALAKPIEKRKWAMVIDTRKCIGCNACSVACIAQNNLPPGITYRKVFEVEDGEYPDVQRYFMPTNCMQCENAPCIEAANNAIPGSMYRRSDGIVAIDYSKMKGRKVFETAKKACPYDNALYYDEGKNYTDDTPAIQPYEREKSREYGRKYSRSETKDSTRKCHFCVDRIENGLLPACVSTCTGQAMYFGDVNIPGSLAAKLINSGNSFILNEGAKTVPAVRFVDENLDETCLKCHG